MTTSAQTGVVSRGACALLTATAAAMSVAAGAGVPTRAASFEHILVIIAENKSYDLIVGPQSAAPRINRLAREYGLATQFFAEVHPSEGNYVAMLGGDTFGIHDDDAFYCKPGMHDHWCPKSSARRLCESHAECAQPDGSARVPRPDLERLHGKPA